MITAHTTRQRGSTKSCNARWRCETSATQKTTLEMHNSICFSISRPHRPSAGAIGCTANAPRHLTAQPQFDLQGVRFTYVCGCIDAAARSHTQVFRTLLSISVSALSPCDCIARCAVSVLQPMRCALRYLLTPFLLKSVFTCIICRVSFIVCVRQCCSCPGASEPS